MTELIKLTQEQHEFIKTFYIGSRAVDKINKAKAIHNISRWGFGFSLTDGNGKEYSFFRPDGETLLQAPFNQDERFKIIDAIINGYEVIKKRYHLYARPYNEVTDQIEKVYFLGNSYRPRTTTDDKKLNQDWGKYYSLEEAEKIKADFEKLGVVLELEEV